MPPDLSSFIDPYEVGLTPRRLEVFALRLEPGIDHSPNQTKLQKHLNFWGKK